MKLARRVLLAIILSSIVLFALFPFYTMLKNSFEPYERIVSLEFHFIPERWTNLDNYREMFLQQNLLRWLLNSFAVTVLTIFGTLLIDVIAAFALARLNFPGRRISFNLVLITIMAPIQAILVPLYLLMIKFHWLNTYVGLIVPMMTSPFGIFLLRQNFIQLPKEIDESAVMDGASYLAILWKIVIPNSLPAIGALTVIKFMWVWGDYLWPALVVKKNAMRTLPLAIAMLRTPTGTVSWHLVTATAVIAVIPVLIMFIYLQKYFVKGVTEGAVKG